MPNFGTGYRILAVFPFFYAKGSISDDLDIAPDFFEYFSATRYLLDNDPLLWCVSAWNDNGKVPFLPL